MSGDHYKKQDTEKHRDPAKRSTSIKLRLVKNHIHRIIRHYTTSILSYAPGVAITPQDELNLQDQKDAELNDKVWSYAKAKHRLKEKIRKWAWDFCGVGEVCVIVRFDPNAGDFIGYAQEVDEDGFPVFDEMGQPVANEDEPVFSGDFIFDRIFAANLRRDGAAKDMREAEWLCVTKMVSTKKLKADYSHDPDIVAKITETQDEEYVVFDGIKGQYSKTAGQTAIREYYFRPCHQYPKGYFYIATTNVILEQGELPYGIWPIAWSGFDEFATNPRGKSIIKVARPYVAEINRASSEVALHQVTLGSDKILYQKGTKLEQGGLLPGVRGLTYQGREPTILQGRDGSQYLPYIQGQIAELDQVMMLDEINMEKNQQLDPMALLYRAAQHHRKFSQYAEKFEQFLIDICEIYLQLAQQYMPDQELAQAIGSNEMANIQEFRDADPLRYKICVQASDSTLEERLGKQMQFQHLLQYVGQSLSRDDIGKIIKEMPFGNFKEAFGDFTMDHDNAKNLMLAIERGEQPQISQSDDPKFMIKKLDARMRRPDFKYLDPMVQQVYGAVVEQYQQMEAMLEQKAMALKNEYIPADGPLVTVDTYVSDPEDPSKPAKRVKLPQRAIEWLIQTLSAQGNSLERLESLNSRQMAEIGQMMLAQGGAMMQPQPQGSLAQPVQPPQMPM